MARPKKEIKQSQFESLCAIQCTEEEICDVLGVTDKTLTRWCKETYGKSFSEIFREKRNLGKTSLRRYQWKQVENGNTTMLIWMGKQLLKQSENPVLDMAKIKELELREKELALKEKIIERQLGSANEIENNVADMLNAVIDEIKNLEKEGDEDV